MALALGGLGAGCGGGGGGGGPDDEVDVTLRGRAVLALLAGSTVEVYRHDDLTRPRGTATTSGGSASEAGRFAVTLEDVLPTDAFLVVVRGGEALDADEDGVLDAVPTPNRGGANAVVTGAQVRSGLEVLVSTVSEAAYQRTRYLWAADYPAPHLAAAAASAVTFVLRLSVDGDADVDGDDGLRFDPLRDASALHRST